MPASRDKSMTHACAFSMNRWVQAKGRIPVSVACFNCSITEEWTANTCLITACLANKGLSHVWKVCGGLLLFFWDATDHTNNTWRTLDQSNNQIIISSCSTGKMCLADSAFGIFRSSDPDLCVLGFCVPRTLYRRQSLSAKLFVLWKGW